MLYTKDYIVALQLSYSLHSKTRVFVALFFNRSINLLGTIDHLSFIAYIKSGQAH